MSKAKEISALWKQIKPQIDEMIRLCYEVESHAEVTADAYRRGYEAGLNDAWECARKIFLPVAQEGLPANALIQIFGNKPTEYILKEYSASEAIEKIRAYEQEQEEQIQVGDEVEWNGDRYVVTYIDVDETYVDVIDCSCGSVCDRLAIKSITKTGRHFPEIAEVLQKMKEEDNG